MRGSFNELVGYATIMGVIGALILFLGQALNSPEVVHALAALSPWAGANAGVLASVAIGIVLVTGLVLPPILMTKDANDGDSLLGKLGAAMCVALLVPSIGYLLAVGWFGAKYLLD